MKHKMWLLGLGLVLWGSTQASAGLEQREQYLQRAWEAVYPGVQMAWGLTLPALPLQIQHPQDWQGRAELNTPHRAVATLWPQAEPEVRLTVIGTRDVSDPYERYHAQVRAAKQAQRSGLVYQTMGRARGVGYGSLRGVRYRTTERRLAGAGFTNAQVTNARVWLLSNGTQMLEVRLSGSAGGVQRSVAAVEEMLRHVRFGVDEAYQRERERLLRSPQKYRVEDMAALRYRVGAYRPVEKKPKPKQKILVNTEGGLFGGAKEVPQSPAPAEIYEPMPQHTVLQANGQWENRTWGATMERPNGWYITSLPPLADGLELLVEPLGKGSSNTGGPYGMLRLRRVPQELADGKYAEEELKLSRTGKDPSWRTSGEQQIIRHLEKSDLGNGLVGFRHWEKVLHSRLGRKKPKLAERYLWKNGEGYLVELQYTSVWRKDGERYRNEMVQMVESLEMWVPEEE